MLGNDQPHNQVRQKDTMSSLAWHLAGVKPSGTVKCAVSPTVGPVLKTVGRKFSPIQGKWLIDHQININCISDAKHHVYTLEDQMWNLKDWFDVTKEEDKEMSWTRMANGEHVAHLLAVSYKLN